MSAYVIGHMTVKDIDKWGEYRRQVPNTLEPWDPRVIFRGQRTEVLTGEHRHSDTVVIQFPDQDSLRGWPASEVYQALITVRNEAAEMVLVINYDGEAIFGEAGRLNRNLADNPQFQTSLRHNFRQKPHKARITLSILSAPLRLNPGTFRS